MSVHRVFVTSVEGYPSFRVHAKARDKFIEQEIEFRHGRQEDGSAHEWGAYAEGEAEVE